MNLGIDSGLTEATAPGTPVARLAAPSDRTIAASGRATSGLSPGRG